ncbi:TolC family outer membrane protein [Oricola thermophila]|nr:TolC family outer membrane protein [Oricola thermophila]
MLGVAIAQPAHAISLNEAVTVAVESNPEIGQAIENREAIEFELRQARGLFLPSIDLEGSVGVRRLDSPGRRLGGIADDSLYPTEVSAVATQTLFNGGGRRAELDRQASRVDSASFRIMERSEYIGLQVVREYLEYLVQARIVEETRQNLQFHRSIQSSIASGVAGGTLTEADRQQVRERVLAAEARLKEAEEELASAKIRFLTLVGKPLDSASKPPSVAPRLPSSLDQAIGLARKNNPRVHMASADIDAADALVDAARADFLPEISLEGRARYGDDIDGSDGYTSDLQARVVARWNLYRGGIDKANEQEQIRRASEQRLVLHQIHREIEEAVRSSWERRVRQASLASTLRQQAQENARLVSSYREQFRVGQRSLLDVLDAQNTRFNVGVLAATAEYASLFAEYRLLAATGQLLSTLGVTPPKQADAYARTEFDVPPTAATETYARMPSRQVNELPMDLLAPVRK